MIQEELLKPRYEVIADYPNSPFEVNKIIEMTRKSKRFPLFGDNNIEDWETWIDGKNGGSTCYSINQFIPYPHLFRKLEWWEKRDRDDLPEYVKFIKDCWMYKKGDVVKVINWYGYKSNKVCIQHSNFKIENVEPATLEEYTNYINTQTPHP